MTLDRAGVPATTERAARSGQKRNNRRRRRYLKEKSGGMDYALAIFGAKGRPLPTLGVWSKIDEF